MWKNRAGYGIMMLGGMLLFFLSGQLVIGGIVLLLAVMACLMALLIRRDASRMEVRLSVPGRVREGREIDLILNVQTSGRIWVTRKIIVDIQVENRMFGQMRQKRVELIYLAEKSEYQIQIPMNCCGQVEFTAEHIWIQDILRLFQIHTGSQTGVGCICYPRRMNIQVETSRRTIGTPKNEGVMQNRRGNDPSEMYDIREYVPGDDIRSIHWKLSSKTDRLILREPSNPSHYRVAVMADYGIENWEMEDREGKEREWNTIIAAGSAICRGLVEKGEKFCMLFPGKEGIQFYEIEDRQDYVRMLTQWMRMPMKKEQGTGLRFLMKQGLNQDFSRLVILAAGRYEQNLEGAESRIGITVVSAVKEAETIRSNRVSESCEIIEIPTYDTEGSYRIMC